MDRFLIKGGKQLHGTVSVSGLGGDPYRDGGYAYYIGEKVVQNDPKGVGAFLLAAGEMDVLSVRGLGKGKTVMLAACWTAKGCTLGAPLPGPP